MTVTLRPILLAGLIALLVAPVFAADRDEEKPTGLPVPRFASLRSEEVNMRAGPGTRYPIEWVYNRKGLPVEIVAEFDIWRRVRDPEGTEGWVHKTEITGKRMAIVTGGPRELREEPQDTAAIKAHLEAGAIGQISSCQRDWCKLKFDGVKGYLRKNQLWGAYPAEVFE
ncbi:MAG: SH3 domain-containing protein [Alphaproteobacteria bacterium]|nr:SH3 domain-containing protein [Alphaproteobacteria bacterium]MBV8548143.1 SH3 domain-containing protein [Alphaproteobacteria bacterium]